MRQALVNPNTIDFSLNSFENLIDFKKLFENLKKGLEKDRKDLLMGRKNNQEEREYFNFMKLLFTSP